MMANQKRPFCVWARYYLDAEGPENGILGEWRMVGDTWAVSEKKAISNMCFRINGKASPYKPVAVGGHWENGVEWKALPRGVDPNDPL